MIGFFQQQPFSLLVFRSFNTRVLYCGNISKVSQVRYFDNLMLIDGDDYSMLEIECLSRHSGLKHDFCQISLNHDLLPQLKEILQGIKDYIEQFSSS
mmetsp:Transcript_31415/g.5685  ORF Transcript_31415/g.5685 Transcript_31415/m.5685 type:complete len:97 (-) Transcript_31415:29-319(-)